MIRSSDIVLTGLMIAAAIWTFQIKYQTENSADTVSSLQAKINREKTKIDLLEADISVLSQPARLQDMADRFSKELELKPLDIDQIITPDELPPIRLPDDPIGALARGDEGIDNILTGSVKEQKP